VGSPSQGRLRPPVSGRAGAGAASRSLTRLYSAEA
jgi:hypothetical protein